MQDQEPEAVAPASIPGEPAVMPPGTTLQDLPPLPAPNGRLAIMSGPPCEMSAEMREILDRAPDPSAHALSGGGDMIAAGG